MSLGVPPQLHPDVRRSAQNQMDELKQMAEGLETLSAQLKLNISEKKMEIDRLRREVAVLPQGWNPAVSQALEAKKDLELAESHLSFLKGTLAGVREDLLNVSLKMMNLIGSGLLGA